VSIKVVNPLEQVSLTDYGCGYGYLYEFMTRKGYHFDYHGYDLSEPMINQARELYGSHPNCHFWAGNSYSKVADYTVASGIFNVKLDKSDQEWEEYVIATLNTLNTLSQSGFAFNILTSYSDREYMRDDLYYANPCFYFDFCKRNFSKNVALLHDYGLYEFTILVRK
jgi:SAM-dependent methyltransferase